MRKNSIFIIEHLEPELYEWCKIEYESISKIVGKSNLWFTNLKNIKNKLFLKKYGKILDKSVKELNLKNACVFDPNAEKTLSQGDCKNTNYFIFGGILGDYPPKKRTKKELTPFIKSERIRNIGKKQMSTDNAVLVVKEISEGKKLGDLKFKDKVEVKISEIESVGLPYRYRVINDRPFMSSKIIEYLKRKKSP